MLLVRESAGRMADDRRTQTVSRKHLDDALEALTRTDALVESLARSAEASGALVRRLSALAQHTKTMFDAMDFGFLFDPTRQLFSIGYRVAENSLDPKSLRSAGV